METGKKSAFKTHINMVPFVALSFSMVAFAIVAVLLLLSFSALKKENAALSAGVESMKAELVALRNAQVINESQEGAVNDGIKDLKARMDALEALKDRLEQPQETQVAPGLSIASFELKFVSNPGYAYQTYTGTGAVSAADAKDSFLVLLKKTLKSGGAPTTKKLEYLLVLVVDGAGTFYTDDSAEGTVEKPEYEFALVGSVRIDSGLKTGK